MLLTRIVAGVALRDAEIAAVTDWPFLLECAARFKILPTVTESLATRMVPPNIRDSLVEARAELAVTQSVMLGDLRLAADALDRVGIPFVVMKGGAMLLEGIVRIGERYLSDIDLRVAPEDLERTRAALTGAGFQFVGQVGYDGEPTRRASPACWAPLGTGIEVHARSDGAPSRTFREELERSVELVRFGTRFRVPTRDALLAGVSEHVLFHHAADPVYCARHIADVRALVATGARARGSAAVASVAMLDVVSRFPTRCARWLLPQGVELRWRQYASHRVTSWWSLPRDLLDPRMAFARLFPHPRYLAQSGVENTARGRIGRWLGRSTRNPA